MRLTSDRPPVSQDYQELAAHIKRWGRDLGFQQVGIADTDLGESEARLLDWLAKGRHGSMHYMARCGRKRARPAELVSGTVRVISARMDYLSEPRPRAEQVLQDPAAGFVSRYALGRDYHKVLRVRLRALAALIAREVGEFGYRVLVDSAPVMEKPLAQRAGLGWIGKHTNLINAEAGSWFFLGEVYTDLPLPTDRPARNHCGTCQACLDVCPTGAIVAPYELDARRCISYLTIELKGAIPEPLRPLMGNRIYGCDDCQLVCPWNRFAHLSPEPDFLPRGGLDAPTLLDLFGWEEPEFLRRTEGSPIRRIKYPGWLRNLAVALGNAPASPGIARALAARADHPSELVRQHVRWALRRQEQGAGGQHLVHAGRSHRATFASGAPGSGAAPQSTPECPRWPDARTPS
jgi:epoxyqueuosine reductase